jgi:DNA ligase (NAD+)
MDRISELKGLLTKYDTEYRSGNEMVSDSTYDALVDELVELVGEEDDFFDSSVKEEETDSDRKEKLPSSVVMASMTKVKNIEELKKRIRLNKIPSDAEYILSPKYDGIAILKDESLQKAWTKGSKDASGLRSDEHLKFMKDVTINHTPYTFGECIISRANYELIKDSFESDSARNAVAGLFRRDYVSSELEQVDFIRYGVFGRDDLKTKKELFDFLNETQKVKVPYKIVKIEDLTEEYLKDVFFEFSKEYDIDGIIIEVNDMSLHKILGRERNGNPKYALAFKGAFEDVAEVKCTDVEYNISKMGNVIPVAIFNPGALLNGAYVTRATINNCSFMKELGLNIGSSVLLKRNGMVTPGIHKVLTKMPFTMPEGIDCEWDENGVHLKTLAETDDQRKKKLFAFFNILGVENVSDKTFDLLFDSGYKTVKDVLLMSQADFLSLDRFGGKKAANVYNDIQSKMKDVPLAKLQHATGCFKLLGSKKLALLEHFETRPSFDEVMAIDGFSEISTENYLNGLDPFWDFVKDLPITWTRTKKVEVVSSDLDGKQFVFTGYRNKEVEEIIKSRKGSIGSGVTSKTSYLVMASKGSGSSKELKAIELGVTVLDKDELIKFLGI